MPRTHETEQRRPSQPAGTEVCSELVKEQPPFPLPGMKHGSGRVLSGVGEARNSEARSVQERVSTSEAGPEQAAMLAAGFERALPAIGLGQAATSLPGSQDQQSGPMLQPCKQPLITTQETPQGTVGRNGPTVAAGSSHSDQQHLKLRQQKLHFFAAQPSAKNLSKTASAGRGSHAGSRVAIGSDKMRTSSNVYGGSGTALAMTVSGRAAVSETEAEPAVTSVAESEHTTASAAGSG